MISVKEAMERILDQFKPLPAETVALDQAHGRIVAAPLIARVTQPPADLSAMDGYAIRFADVPTVPTVLRVVGQAPAGGAYAGTLKRGEAVRIFTGGPVPAGADTIVIQENTQASGDTVTVLELPQERRHIRRAGLDFKKGAVLLAMGRRLNERDLMLAAAMNHPSVPVHRKPRVAVLGTGDELVPPGTTPGPGGNFVEGRYGLTLGVAANLMAKWEIDASWTKFGGAGRFNDINDRDFVAATVKFSF